MMVAARVKPSTTTPTQSSLTSLRVEAMWARPWMVEELRNSATEVSSPDITRPETGKQLDQMGDYCEVGHTSASDLTHKLLSTRHLTVMSNSERIKLDGI